MVRLMKLIAASLFIFGCAVSCSSNAELTGSVRLLITDKPYPVSLISSALVTITRVEVRQTDESEDASASSQPSDAGSTNSDASPFITIFDNPAGKSFDLLQLQAGKTDLLADASVPVGTYDQMRLIVTEGEITLTDGRKFTLTVPSGEQTGIKLHFTFTVTASDQPTTLLLDVDLSRAFTPVPGGQIDSADKIRDFHFSPSVAMRLIDVASAGNISGKVKQASDEPVAGALVTAVVGTQEVQSTSTLDDGTFTILGLPPGAYTLQVSATGFADAQVNDVSVSAAQTTTVADVVLTAAP